LNKNDIEVDFVNPKYTSRTCPICGHISKNNRSSQENFICEKCNHRDNADLNASINILQRIMNDTFRNAFEYYDKKAKMFKGRKIRNLKVYQDIYKKELA
jgi:putative transposase